MIAQDWDELISKPKRESFPLPVSSSIIKPNKTLKPLKPVSPGFAFFLASIPATSSFLIWGISSLGSGDNVPISIYAISALIILPIPEHIYIHDNVLKNIIITIGKITFLAVFIGNLEAFGHDVDCENNCGNQHDPEVGMAVGLSGIAAIYLYELIDAPFAAIRYNEKIKEEEQQQEIYVQPSAWKGEYRVNVGYRF